MSLRVVCEHVPIECESLFSGLDGGTNNTSFQTIPIFFTALLNPECFLPPPLTPNTLINSSMPQASCLAPKIMKMKKVSLSL